MEAQYTEIQIHPMLRLNRMYNLQSFLWLYSNTSHVTVKPPRSFRLRARAIIQIHPMLRLNNPATGCQSHTPYIQIHPMLRLNRAGGMWRMLGIPIQIHPMLRLNWSESATKPRKVIQIHPMLRLNQICQMVQQSVSYSNTSHVTVKLNCKIPVDCMKLNSNTSHVTVKLLRMPMPRTGP